MTSLKSSLVGGLALSLGLVCWQAQAQTAATEWVAKASVDPYTVQPAPSGLALQPQNPPAFAWPRYPVSPKPSYILEISTAAGAVVATYTAPRNFYLPSKAMVPGSYTWRVRPNIAKIDWSAPRGFVIGSATASRVFEVPETDVLRSKILAHGRPRMLSPTFLPYAKWTPAMIADRGAAFAALVKDIDAGMSGTATAVKEVTEASISLTGLTATASATVVSSLTTKIYPILHQFEGAMMLYRLTGNTKYRDEAFTRGNQAALLDPSGATSYASQDQVTRNIAVSLMRGLDMLGNDPAFDDNRRALWTNAMVTRTEAIYADLSGNDGRLDEAPYDSHGTTAYGYLALIASMAIGDIPAADKWFDFAVRPYVNSIFIWSGPEGGYFPGTAYAMYTATSAVQLWGALKEASGIDLYKKPWSIGFARMLMQFIPPGTPSLVFGDEHEVPFDYSALKAYAGRIALPETAWYAKSVAGGEDPLQLLASEYPLPAASVTPAAPPNASLFPSIGWASMHSDITNPKRTSLYFKSSPYGSYNHAHGDQNALVLDSNGKRLLWEAGYEDAYYSTLVTTWYRTTRAHNAITYDGGVGQLITGRENLTRNGKITSFSTSSSLDYVEGDATVSYGPEIKSAIRRVWYLRTNNAFLVQDKISTVNPHKFEWNMHSIVPILPDGTGKGKARIAYETASAVTSSVCLTSLTPDTTLQKVDGPSRPKVTETHAAFVKDASLTSTEFLVLLDVDCKRPVVTVTPTSSGRTVLVNGQSITIPN